MNTNSETTWINAASKGLRKPKAASTMPRASTPRVPAKFCQMVRRTRPGYPQRFNETHKIVAKQHHIGAFARHVCAGAHGNAHARLDQGGSVVHAVADHGNDAAFALNEGPNARELLLGKRFRLRFPGCRAGCATASATALESPVSRTVACPFG